MNEFHDCDFCKQALANIWWDLPCKDMHVKIIMVLGEEHRVLEAEFKGNWHACDPCGQDLYIDDLNHLYSRMVESMIGHGFDMLGVNNMTTLAQSFVNAYKEGSNGEPVRHEFV